MHLEPLAKSEKRIAISTIGESANRQILAPLNAHFAPSTAESCRFARLD
jgi:hypothetical protein